MYDSPTQQPRKLNGLDLDFLQQTAEALVAQPAEAQARFRVASRWQDGTRSAATVSRITVGGNEIPRAFTIAADEPAEFGGGNTAPNPQELLLAALNACMLVGYACQAALAGLKVHRLELEVEADLDLRGFLGVSPGCSLVRQTVEVEAEGTAEQWEQIHAAVQATSPNYWNVTQPVKVVTALKFAG
jgi:uncharacterized OsmC-like protein